MATLKEILEQAEALPQEDQKKLASYFVLKFINPDTGKLAKTIFQNIDANQEDKQNSPCYVRD